MSNPQSHTSVSPKTKGTKPTSECTTDTISKDDEVTFERKKLANCWSCGEDGHVSRNWPKKNKDGESLGGGRGQQRDLKCFYCGGEGHYKRDCPLLKPTEYSTTLATDKPQDGAKQPKKPRGTESRSGHHHMETHSNSPGYEHQHSSGRGRGRGQATGRGYDQAGGRGRGSTSEYHRQTDPLPLYDQYKSLPSFLDTHCHVEYLMERLRIRKYRELARRYCYPRNYDGCITSFCDPAGLSSLSQADQLLADESIWGSFGVHPHHASYLNDNLEDRLIARLREPKCVAFGEIGLDYSEHSLQQSNKEKQKEVVTRLLTMAPIFEKPLVIHCRDADEDLYRIMKDVLSPSWKIHLHCYTGSLEMAQRFTLDFSNLYIGVTGHVTYNKFRQTRDVVRTLPLERILLETDAPYMPPTGVEERWSHPPMVIYVAEEIARTRGVAIDDVLVETRKNATSIYGV